MLVPCHHLMRLIISCSLHSLTRLPTEDFRFLSQPCARIGWTSRARLLNAVPGDFNRDGQLDMLLMFAADDRAAVEMRLYYGNRTAFGMNM